jgi:hypothetical protein
MTRDEIFEKIQEERNRQDVKWVAYDDKEHTAIEWAFLICKHLYKCDLTFKEALIRVAALAIAALETGNYD